LKWETSEQWNVGVDLGILRYSYQSLDSPTVPNYLSTSNLITTIYFSETFLQTLMILSDILILVEQSLIYGIVAQAQSGH